MKDALQLIKEKIGEYKTSAVLKIISRITWEGPTAFGFHGQKADQLKLSTFMLSIIAKTAIIHTDESAHKKDQTTFQDIGRLLDIFHDHLHEKQFENAKKKSGKLSAEDLHSFVIRLTQQQLRYQRGFHQELARSLLIYNDLLKQKRQRIDYEKAFHELYGMNLERFLQIAYAILGQLSRAQTR